MAVRGIIPPQQKGSREVFFSSTAVGAAVSWLTGLVGTLVDVIDTGEGIFEGVTEGSAVSAGAGGAVTFAVAFSVSSQPGGGPIKVSVGTGVAVRIE